MKTSEVTLSIVKGYLRVDTTADDALITAILSASKQFACSYTGLSATEMDSYEDIPLAILSLCADMYDVRQATLTGTQLNPTVYQILGSHSKNLVPEVEKDEVEKLLDQIAELKHKIEMHEKKQDLLDIIADLQDKIDALDGDGE